MLTDTLEHLSRQGQLPSVGDPLAEEGERAAELKESERFTVVIGNPPYHRQKREVGARGTRKGGVVRYGNESLAPLLTDIKEPMEAAGLGNHLKNVQNDYVYFWRWAVWQATELPEGPGVIAFITASSYLEGISMGGLRHLLRGALDELWIVDLGGQGRGAYKDDNIFAIRTPVAIAIGIRTGREPACECTVRYIKITGTRAEKLASLSHMALSDVSNGVSGRSLDRFTPRSDHQQFRTSGYFDWPKVTDLFPWAHSGCQVKRLWPIAETETLLMRRWRELLSAVPRERTALFRKTRDRKIDSRLVGLSGTGTRLSAITALDIDDSPEGVERYGYRSHDRQWIIADIRAIDYPRRELWNIRGSGQVYLSAPTATKLSRGPVLTATPYVPDLHFSRGGNSDVMPLHRTASGKLHNVADGLLAALGQALGVTVAAEDLCAYVYALGATPAFSDKFGEGLAEEAGPIRIPMTAHAALFAEAVTLGRDLLWWHTWGERFAPDGNDGLPVGSCSQIRPVIGMPNRYAYEPERQTLIVGNRCLRPNRARGLGLRGVRPEGSALVARLPHGRPQGQNRQPYPA